jgi:nucleotide-binding universal stress UspA family protein
LDRKYRRTAIAGPRNRDKRPIGGNPRREGFKTLVVATDFTPGAAWAAGRAGLLPIVPGAEVRILHVLPDGMPAEVHGRAESLSRLRGFLESLGDRGVLWKTTVRSGDPRVEILREAERRRADLVVLGTHGRTGVSHALLGSVAEWIVRRAERDVLVARAAPVSFDLP